MGVYFISGFALFVVAFIVLGPILGIIPNKGKQEKVGRAGRYFQFFFFSQPSYFFALILVDDIHHRGTSAIFVPSVVPFIGLVLWAIVIILSAYLTLNNSAAPLRWIIFTVISSGVIVSFLLLLEFEPISSLNRVLLALSLVAYFVPQLLLFVDKKKENDIAIGTTDSTLQEAKSI